MPAPVLSSPPLMSISDYLLDFCGSAVFVAGCAALGWGCLSA